MKHSPFNMNVSLPIRLLVLIIILASFLLNACAGKNPPLVETSLPQQTSLPTMARIETLAIETVSTTFTSIPATEASPRKETTPTPTQTPKIDVSLLSSALDSDVDWHILLKDLDTGDVIFKNKPDALFNPASMIKIPLALAVLDINHQMGRTLADLKTIGPVGRSFAALLEAMVVLSEEQASQDLEFFARGDNRLRNTLISWDMPNTTYHPRLSTCNDLATALEGIHNQRFIPAEMNDFLLDLMLVQTENDSKYLGVIPATLPGASFANKRGTMTGPTVVADHGLLSYQGKTWIVIIAGTPDENGTATFETIAESIERFGHALAEELKRIYPE